MTRSNLTIILTEPPTANGDGTFSVRGRMTAPDWGYYRLALLEDATAIERQALAGLRFNNGLTALHDDELGALGSALRHLSSCEAPVMTIRFDLRTPTATAAPTMTARMT